MPEEVARQITLKCLEFLREQMTETVRAIEATRRDAAVHRSARCFVVPGKFPSSGTERQHLTTLSTPRNRSLFRYFRQRTRDRY